MTIKLFSSVGRYNLHALGKLIQYNLTSSFSTISTSEIDTPMEKDRLSKRHKRKLLAKEKKKKLKREQKSLTHNPDPGFNTSVFNDTEYYFENGLRKVYPYYFTFSSYVKRRWVGMTVPQFFSNEFNRGVLVDTDEYEESIKLGKLKLNGKPFSLDYRMKDGDFIEHTIHRHENPVVGSPLAILVDNKDVIVINKPSSIPCHPCGRYRYNSLAFILGKEYGYPNLRNIYRLDRLTSGVLIFAKTAEATRKYEDEIRKRLVQKEYVCRVVGEFPEGEVVCDQPLDVFSLKIAVHRVNPSGKESKTAFRRLSYNGKTSVVKCVPYTGRTHQIRVHLQYLGHPIVNDPIYNSPAFGPNRGKGGLIWKSEDEMIAVLLEHHNVGQWIDGENPLYHRRLREVESQVNPEDQTSASVENEADYSDSEPQIKRTKLASSAKFKSADGGNSEDKCVELINVDLDGGQSNDSGNKDSNISTDFEESEQTARIKKEDISVGCKIQYPSFDESKWIPDKLCDSCRKNYIDPSLSDLVMFLHALSYKGPDWEYKTELPDWAQEDWIDDTVPHENKE